MTRHQCHPTAWFRKEPGAELTHWHKSNDTRLNDVERERTTNSPLLLSWYTTARAVRQGVPSRVLYEMKLVRLQN
jgi:hypothetical protein